MISFWWLMWLYGLFVQPQPAYQIQYQQQLLNAVPQVIHVNNGVVTGGQQYVYFPPCQVYPGVTVCP